MVLRRLARKCSNQSRAVMGTLGTRVALADGSSWVSVLYCVCIIDVSYALGDDGARRFARRLSVKARSEVLWSLVHWRGSMPPVPYLTLLPVHLTPPLSHACASPQARVLARPQ